MVLNIKELLIIFFLFHLIINEEVSIRSYEELDVPKGTSNYSYQFTESSLPEGKDGYFYFKFNILKYYYPISLSIIQENGNESSISLTNKNWFCYNITNLKSQKFIFSIEIAFYDTNISVLFLDGTKEINFTLDQFINLNFTSTSVSRPPIPLTFNLITLEEQEGFYYFKENEKNDILYDADYLLFYCELEENQECSFTGFQSLFFDKNKKYKIKLNFYKDNYYNNYYYYFIYFSSIKEIEFDSIRLDIIKKGVYYYRYYLLNVENITNNNDFFIYSNTSFYGGFMDENDKDKLPDYIDQIYFSSYSNGINTITKTEENIFVIKCEYSGLCIF